MWIHRWGRAVGVARSGRVWGIARIPGGFQTPPWELLGIAQGAPSGLQRKAFDVPKVKTPKEVLGNPQRASWNPPRSKEDIGSFYGTP